MALLPPGSQWAKRPPANIQGLVVTGEAIAGGQAVIIEDAILYEAAGVGRSDMNEGWMLKESHTYEKRPT
jgi:hypothetical protein